MHGFMLMAEQCGCQRLSECVSKCITRLRQQTGALYFFFANVRKDTRPSQSASLHSCFDLSPRLARDRPDMARYSFLVTAAAAVGCAAFTAPARTPLALSLSVPITSRGARLGLMPSTLSMQRQLCGLSHRGSPNWLMCAQVHAATDEYQSRPLRRPGCLCGTEPAAQGPPRLERRPGRQVEHLGRRAEDGGRSGRGRVWRRPDRHRSGGRARAGAHRGRLPLHQRRAVN